ncbi:beta-glucosidase [Streptomyces sp. NL15-2K]|nr:beta-glucosidase [Streptomyces sp. NL15-2K]
MFAAPPTSFSDDKIGKLASRLSLEQKVAQLTCMNVMNLLDRAAHPSDARSPVVDPGKLAALRPHGLGHLAMAWFLGHDADSSRSVLAGVQEAVREVSPYGSGAMVHNDAVNGFMHVSGSQFPTAWAKAATWQPDLVRRAAAVSAAHMRDAGMQLALSPLMDLARTRAGAGCTSPTARTKSRRRSSRSRSCTARRARTARRVCWPRRITRRQWRLGRG